MARLFGNRAAILPREAGGEPWLAAVIAVLCFLACMAAAGATGVPERRSTCPVIAGLRQ